MEGTIHAAGFAREKKVCVIVPTYNNGRTLQRVVRSVLEIVSDLIIVNDGSTDKTPEILAGFPQVTTITFARNSGKGMALRAGFQKALELGFDYAITIDSDGQHFPADIPIFLKALQQDGDALLIGSRNMTQEGVPKKSSFGNKFSNFWFWFETGIKLQDTQSGYRLYPLHLIPKKFYTRKFEFEIEVIVRTAWNGVLVKNIPVQVKYDPSERVSHFRPFRDFSRISVLNTILVLNLLIYIAPRNFFLKLREKGLKKFFLENIISSNDSHAKKACSVALGVFIGIAPLWGLQTVIVLFLAALLRLNRTIAFTFSNISIPPMIPIIVYASLLIGGIVTGKGGAGLFDADFTLDDISQNILQYIVGSLILATLTASVFGISAYMLMRRFSTGKSPANA
ncbi:MAG TPA: DUF2062 domain-containing protein [Flavobacterium sp.]|jgi:glycosyltransferase involved in cell wall biosynthesis